MAETSSIAVQSSDAHTSNNEEQTRLVAYELRKLHAFDSQIVSLVPVGDWSLDTTPEALDCRTSASGRSKISLSRFSSSHISIFRGSGSLLRFCHTAHYPAARFTQVNTAVTQ